MKQPSFGYFSMCEHGAGESDSEYLRWHQLDHMPEQWRIPGIGWGQRWASTPACKAARAAEEAQWATLSHVVNYLMLDPIEETLDDFFGLATELREMGRFPFMLPSLFQGALRLLETHAAPRALVSPLVVPFRPNRGIYLIVEEPSQDGDWDAYVRGAHEETIPALLSIRGVAGAWVYGTTSALTPREIYTPGRYRVTVCYLDDEPAVVGERIAEQLQRAWRSDAVHGLIGAPFESIVETIWDRF